VSAGGRRGTGPGEARQILDELETVVAAETDRSSEAVEGGLHGDLVPQIPGGSEPPD
jgi:hypothetical protein